ncbi:L-seryl-tRNA(Sec) kinase [Gopherus flavomarginatus]|uniref:L-seryl-tRNA(Sec) kinase n=1 Tax=Gopherus flavomarginatus TaxID=286002 RepID=UPI0021CC25E6|nr:L-seryl-tRNA(Sec) kinase [Gopherus flavomarginatus]
MRVFQRAERQALTTARERGAMSAVRGCPQARSSESSPPDSMETAGFRRLGVCVLCGLPAAGKSTLARALHHILRRREGPGWDCALVTYDDLIPQEAFSQPETEAGLVAQQPLLSRWKLYRHELLVYLEHFLQALINGDHLCAPTNRTEATWKSFVSCFKEQGLISSEIHDAKSCHYLINTTTSRPLYFVLDDNFYYQSMRYEVYQLARKYSLGFCQLFLDCPLESCLQRNCLRSQPLPDETICLMARKTEVPNPEKNTWEQNSLILKSVECTSEDNLQVINLLVTALENPVKQIEENIEQKETDRAICAASILHQADQAFRRIVSQTMKDVRDKNVLPNEMKILAEELNKLKAEFLEDLRQENHKKNQFCLPSSEFVTNVITSFQQATDNVVKKVFFFK